MRELGVGAGRDSHGKEEPPRQREPGGESAEQFRRTDDMSEPGEEQHQRDQGGGDKAGHLARFFEAFDDLRYASGGDRRQHHEQHEENQYLAGIHETDAATLGDFV